MTHAIYTDLARWYHLLDPVADHAEESLVYYNGLKTTAGGQCERLLELGSGAGHNAFHLKRNLNCTLVDPAEPMLALSRKINPECTHVGGDMRDVRLDERFDAVLIHDAIAYMTTEADLAKAAATAFFHLRPGGAAMFAPDCLRETWAEHTDDHGGDDGALGLRCLEWMYDPDPDDTHYTVDYVLLLRDEDGVRAVHDRHVEGIFDEATWRRVLGDAGFEVAMTARPVAWETASQPYTEQVFICRRPA